MITQLRTRNYILARYGPGVYGFVHRAFLEYLAAADIAQRFDDRELTDDDLLTLYTRRGSDPTWSEVLLLLIGLKERFVPGIIDTLLAADPAWWFTTTRPPAHALLAIRALREVRPTTRLQPQSRAVVNRIIAIQHAIARRQRRELSAETPDAQILAAALPTFRLLRSAWAASADHYRRWHTMHRPGPAPDIGAELYVAVLPHTELLRATTDDNWAVRRAALQALTAGWADHDQTLPLLRDRATTDPHPAVRQAALQAIAAGWADHDQTLPLLRDRATTDPDEDVRRAAVQALAAGWADRPTPCPCSATAPPPTPTRTCGRRRSRRSPPAGPTTTRPCPCSATAPPPTPTRTCGGRRCRPSPPAGPTTTRPCPCSATAPPPTPTRPCGGRRCRPSPPAGPTTTRPCPCSATAPPPTPTRTCGGRRCRRFADLPRRLDNGRFRTSPPLADSHTTRRPANQSRNWVSHLSNRDPFRDDQTVTTAQKTTKRTTSPDVPASALPAGPAGVAETAEYDNSVRIGYARVSTRAQDHRAQLDALAGADCREVIVETASTRTGRPQLYATLARMQPGDTLVVYKPDRIARSMKELLVLLEDHLHARGINLHILTGISASTHRPDGATIADKMLFLVAAMAAEMERDLTGERTLDGLRAAAAHGRRGGRPAKVDDDVLAIARARQNKGESIPAIARHLGIGRSTLYRAFDEAESPPGRPAV